MMFRAILIVVTAALLSLHAAPVGARGDLVQDHDACVLKVGPELIYFAGYQPAASHRKFCEDAPGIGETIFVFDYAEPELREMKAGFRILRQTDETDDTADVEAATVAYLPPQAYPKGTFSFEHVFAQSGEFVGVLTIDGAQGEHWTARFPFSVGRRQFELTPYLLIAAATGLAVLLVFTNRRSAKGARGKILRR
jgi:hypothetical protein